MVLDHVLVHGRVVLADVPLRGAVRDRPEAEGRRVSVRVLELRLRRDRDETRKDRDKLKREMGTKRGRRAGGGTPARSARRFWRPRELCSALLDTLRSTLRETDSRSVSVGEAAFDRSVDGRGCTSFQQQLEWVFYLEATV